MDYETWVFKLMLAAAAAYAIYKGLQAVAIFALVGLFVIFYKRHILEFKQLLLEAIRNTRQAKFKDFELQLAKDSIAFEALAKDQPLWVRLVAAKLDPAQIGVLLSLQDGGHHEITDGLKTQLRVLRNTGLIEHDAASLENSSAAWLSSLGQNLIQSLLLNQ